MTDKMQTIQDDLAYMKALATEGRRAPLLGGAIGVAGGLIYGVTAFVCWALQRHIIVAPEAWQALVWLVAFVIFMAVLVVLVRRIRTKPGASALSNRAVRAVGAGNGYATFAFAIGTVYLSVKFQTWYVWVAFSAAVLALYGVNWMVAAAMSGRQWYRGIAVASFVGTVVLLLSIGTGYEFLIYGLGLLFLVALPGWLMMREEPSEIV